MANRTSSSHRLLLWCLGILCVTGKILGADQEVQDFEFADSDSVVKIVKRAAVVSDDEDFLSDEPGSGPDTNDEGSGTSEVPVMTTRPAVDNLPRYYRVTVNITNISYVSALGDRNSVEFRQLSADLQLRFEELFVRARGQVLVTILNFSEGSLLVTFDLGSQGDVTEGELRHVLEEAIRTGNIGNAAVSPQGFSFRPLDVNVQCPTYVGRAPDALPRGGDNYANLLINNAFPCDGTITGWEYYRLSPQGSAFVGVWRQRGDAEFVLVRKTQLPAAPVGVQTVNVDFHIPVQRGDFIGIFYPRTTRLNVIASATIDDDVVASNELYQNFRAQIYDDMIEPNVPFNINNIQLTPQNATFSIRAIMDYTGVGRPDITVYTCRPDEFSCGDGNCIKAEYQCDRQADCPNGADEEECQDGELEPCLEGRFRCADGSCIPRNLRCDGNADCRDGSDEFRCSGCTNDEFTCRSGECIPLFVQCNKVSDCLDGSDEEDCASVGPTEECRAGEYRCLNGSCIPGSLRCDSRADCPDRDDELRCTCTDSEFQCHDGPCIDGSKVCDAFPDCLDYSDEDSEVCLPSIPTVPPSCPEALFRCDSGICIELRRICDGIPDCFDGEDEGDCGSEMCSEGEFRCDNGECIEGRLECDQVADCEDRSDEMRCVTKCSRAEFTCNSGECIDFRARCDGILDCQDRSDEANCPCRVDEFQCSSGECVSINKRCDRNFDCRDRSDEMECPCRPDEFRCGSGRCIPLSRTCDRQFDCEDRSDEDDCGRCTRLEFECADGICVDVRYRCDRFVQCEDGSDEANCNCSSVEFRCNNGQCIPRQRHCDQNRDCFDGSDEVGCRPVCRETEFACVSDGQCIDTRRRCDGRVDCRDGSDERECQPIRRCPENQFQCDSGHCLDMARRCDGRPDCPAGSDERDCPTCAPTQFSCASGQCIASSQRCDRRSDCQDGSDERDCPCAPGEFTCVTDGQCLPPGYRCNGVPDCRDGSDETDCARRCTEQEFQCSNGQCISRVAYCDGRFDCPDGSDERNCPTEVTISISPQQMRKRVGTSASFVCMVTGTPPPRVVWTRRTGGAMPPQAVISDNRLTITNLRPEDAGDYLCQAISPSGTFDTVARLMVDYIGPTQTPDPDGPCGPDQSTCSNGQCIAKDYLCDGEADCVDESDERNCRSPLPCEPNEFRCNNGRCALKIWRCDGDDDCFDQSDEQNCLESIPGAPCQADEFKCHTDPQCVPLSYQCDGELDCQDRSDEIGCIEPSIITPPVAEITVEVNGTFTIICAAVGTPTPLIVWRLNWGNIPTGDRVTVTSVDGVGSLTVRNVVPEDAGAYTCEAINNRGSIFAIPDALIIVRRTVGICQSPRFNAEASTPEECVRCFCFGQTQTCYSSNLQLSQIALGNQVALVRRSNMEPAEQGFIQYIPASREFEVRDFNTVLRTGSYYWSLPYQYLSKRLSSYGGELTYDVYYDVDGFVVPTNDPDVILTGNGITLHHRSNADFRPRAPTTVRVPLVERSWERTPDPRGGGPISEYATREDLMMVLENVTSILIRATYDNRQSLIRVGNVLLTTGVIQNTGLGRAVYVEECTCPTGYTGFSCEDCAAGFYKVSRGRFGRECVACNCNGHSNDCDPLTGTCRNCRDNTRGLYCNECAEGYVGDPRSGRPDACQPCPCPLSIPSNQFSRTCIRDVDGEVTCTACPEGYTGRRCERCADGYDGNPSVPGSRCRPRGDVDVCDQRGSISSLPDVVTRQCSCKANVEGQFCNQCKPDTFYLSADLPYGCIACFCMGVTQTCQSTTWNRAQLSLAFSQSPSGVYLTDMMQKQRIEQGLTIDRNTRELIFRGFRGLERGVYYWALPQQFLGDRVTAYGGMLRFTVRYRPGRDPSPISSRNPLVEIGGNDITLIHRIRDPVPAGRTQSFSVPLIETAWLRLDGERATREHLMMTLADLEFILIQATFAEDTEESAISGISMDIAEDRTTGQERAYPVEQCACPRGYKGLSCEDCDTGYTRTGGGLYLGLCEPCQCNSHSSECDPETGVCRSCRHNTEGDHCERCARGYYGDATRGTVYDCQRCPCPLMEPPNQFSPDCILDTDGQVTCTACPIGHVGRRCERCADGYQGNPNQPGDFCKLINVTCDCDERGTVPNTLCDPETQQCVCKNNVMGRRCSACREGYFYLSSENDMGCLKCFCMGVTTQCSSSNYYRDVITPMMNSDGTHNFMLTNRRLSRTISDGFSMNADRSEITFNNFEGIQREQESLFFQLPPKFRGDKVSSYGGFLKFGLSYTTAQDTGRDYPDVDVEIISTQDKRMYYLFRPSPQPRQTYTYEIPLVETSFRNLMDGQVPTREAFIAVLANIDAILIRATYHSVMTSVSLRDLRMEIAVPRPTGLAPAPMVESCACPVGYTGLSCQACAPGFLRMEDSGTALGRCVMCNCNNHATSCDSQTGVCQNCQHNTEGDRCERCARGYYGDATAGTPTDCRVCPCPLTIPTNQFSPTCYQDQDGAVTCDRCPTGYTGRDCGQCAPGYKGNPREPGGRCEIDIDGNLPEVIVNPVNLVEPLGSTATFQCTPRGRGPFNVVWSRLDGRPLPRRAVQAPGPNYLLTINTLEYGDSARYVCVVSNAFGSTRDYVTLSVERPDTPIRIRIEEPTNLVTRPGQTARFICVAVQYSSAANYVLSWMKNGGSLPSKAIDQNGVLIIPNLDENDVGTYTCTGSDPASSDTANAYISFGTIEEPPSVRIDPRYLQVSEGARVEFRCIAEGSPRPTVRWNKGPNGPLPSYITTDDTGLFVIPSVTMADQSEYFCTATNSEGSTTVRTIIYVQRAERVEVIVRRTNITAIIGESERLVCYAEGGNGITLSWSREGGLPLGASQENGVLTLPNIQPSYGGTYVCTGTSATGIIGSAVVRVTVIGTRVTAPTARIDPDRQTVGAGTTATLRCIVTGDPPPEIKWTTTRGSLSPNHQVAGEVLRIIQATMDDRSIYVCTATNVGGRAQASAMVEIERREPPQIKLYPDNQQVTAAGAGALFQCQIIGGMPAPTITWTRAGGREFTSRTEVKADMGVLMFTDLTTQEQGEYMCSATNEVGTVTATASLRVEGPPVIDITPGTRITSIVGERVNIECVGIGDPTPNVFWTSPRRRSDVLPEAYDAGPGTAHLLFERIQKVDEGRYICVATNDKGKVEESVDITVLESGTIQPAVVIDGPQTRNVVLGQSVELTCTSQGIPDPRVRWRRPSGQVLPPGHSVRDGRLFIPRIEPEYAGEYICTVTSASVPADFSASIYIIVTVTPRLAITPSRLTSRPGQAFQLRCQSSGPGPFNIEWNKVGGTLSPEARETDGVLDIPRATPADAGRYRCVATGPGGTSEAFADVIVVSPPTIDIQPRQTQAVAGNVVEFRCNVQGDLPITIRWEKEGGELPLQHQIRNGLLTLYNVQVPDTGRYICTASNTVGTVRDFGYLRVASQGIISTGPGMQTVKVGDRVEFECVVTGTTPPTVTWTKLEGPISPSATLSDSILVIPQARPEDSGTYRCFATNNAGVVQSQVFLTVQSSPVISVQQDYTTAALGSPAQLRCDAKGSPEPRISWAKEQGDLPIEHSVLKDGNLFIPRVREEDGGTYNCLAINQFGTSRYPVILVVGSLVPYFQQNPLSYMSFAPLSDVYLDLDILLSFRPEVTDGLLLYNGQYTTPFGDFVCFGMQGQYPEFRFDIGAGPAVIRGASPLELNKWHTVQLKRDRKNGTMLVNDEPAYYGEAPGEYQGLDLSQPMYVGSVPDFTAIPRSAGFTAGFVGGLGQIRLKGVDLNMGAEAREIVGVEQYQVCQNHPCLNGGICRPYNNEFGFVCDCQRGWVGEHCQQIGERCYTDACGRLGRCYNHEDDTRFSCICPMGVTGEGCTRRIEIADPAFNKTSFISYPTIKNGLLSARIRLMFKLNSLDDGIILYNNQRQDGKQDFISIIVKDRHLEFRFDTGSGPAILRSRQPLQLNDWTMVMADRKGRDGMLIVNSDESVNEVTPPSDGLLFPRPARGDVVRGSTAGDQTIGLNLERPMYLGGVDPAETVNANAGAFKGFVGCIGEVMIGDDTLELIADAIESMNVQDCGDRSQCDMRPCHNNAPCVDISPAEYRCKCSDQFTGKNCETEINLCVMSQPCENGGMCIMLDIGNYRCDCPLGWTSRNCEEKIVLESNVEFHGDGYVEVRKSLFEHLRQQRLESIRTTIRTTERDGLFFWQGFHPGQQEGKDYLALSVEDGHVVFRYELGSGPAVIKSLQPIDDGYEHVVEANRFGRSGNLTIDNLSVVTGTSQGSLQVINVDMNLFFGGVPDLTSYTADLFSRNFIGCISNVRLNDEMPLNLTTDAMRGINVRPCLDN